MFERYLKHVDQPSIDGLNTFTVSALARQHGMKVVLSGLGGDELFGGYSSFTKIPQMLRLHPWLSRVPGMAAMLRHGKPQHRRLADFLRSSGTVDDAFSALRGIFCKAEAASLTRWICGDGAKSSLQATSASALSPQLSALSSQPSALSPQLSTLSSQPSTLSPQLSTPDSVSLLELTRYMRNQLLRDSDVMSMAHSLELRVPFVDRVLAEKVASIPTAQRIKPNKGLLTAAVPEVPDWVVNQKKRGFLFPYQKWLGGHWGTAFEEATHGSPVPTAQWYQRWSVFVLKHCLQSLGIQP